jgi:hypothetical protein
MRTDRLKVCVMIDAEVVDSDDSVESFCVCRTETNKTQSQSGFKVEYVENTWSQRLVHSHCSFQNDQAGLFFLCVIYCHSKFIWSKLLGYTTYYVEHELNPA